MQTMGSLAEKPVFDGCYLTVTYDKTNALPIKVVAEDDYEISTLGGISCTSMLTECFTYGGVSLPPRAEALRAALHGTP